MIHFEVLVEDSSGKRMLEHVLPRIVKEQATFTIHSYRGVGRIQKNETSARQAKKKFLLNQLPRLISGYGKAFSCDPPCYRRVVIVICDLDDRNKEEFEVQLNSVVEAAEPAPLTLICLAIEEGEAWLLGDREAVLEAYPSARCAELYNYVPDSICGTWELLADVVVRGGVRALKRKGYQEIGNAKHEWAEKIAPRVARERNRSPSFEIMCEKIDAVLREE